MKEIFRKYYYEITDTMIDDFKDSYDFLETDKIEFWSSGFSSVIYTLVAYRND